MFAEKVTEEQRVERAHVQVMRDSRYMFLTNVMMIGNTEVIDADITACTDGKNTLYGRAFIASLTDAELRFLILHENFHKMYRHLRTWRSLHLIDPRLTNMACDYVINLQITNENADGFAVMPEGGLLDKRFAGMDTKQVFDILKQPPEEGEEGGEEGEEGEEGGSKLVTGAGSGETLDVHDWEGAAELTDEEAEELEVEIETAIRQGSILAGRHGGSLSEEIKQLMKPKLDWKKITRDFVQARCAGKDYGTYAKPNRRFIGSNIYLPSPVSETIPELCIGMDTSGSCWSFLPYFLAELKSICKDVKALKVHILFWDTSVVYEKVEGSDVAEVSIKHAYGGGGTDVNCVTKYLSKHKIKPTASIIMTDGYLNDGWSTWNHPVLWVLVNNERAIPPTGKYVRVEDKEWN